MMVRRRHAWLLAVIVIELAGAALVLRWLFGPAAPAAPPEPAATPAPPITISLPEGLATELRAAVEQWADSHSHVVSQAVGQADLRVTWQKRPGARPVAEWVLVPVAAFPSLRRDVEVDDLRDAWLGRGGPEASVSQLIVTPEVAAALGGLWGDLAVDARTVVVPAAEVIDRVWQHDEESGYNLVAIVPFEQLDPRLSPLTLDGMSALHEDLNLAGYSLVARLWGAGQPVEAQSLSAAMVEAGVSTNRHRERLTEVVVTGVTALTRGVALEIEARGDHAWPARSIAATLAAADVTHVSNEVSFVPGCEAEAETTAFCARPEYLDALRACGVDVVELTGNHNLDFGPSPARYSLALYKEEGMHVFGGGEDAQAARRPLVVEHNSNRIAFLGYNAFGPHYAWAGTATPGAARFSVSAAESDVGHVGPQASLIVVTMQYTETYETLPLRRQVADFRAVADAGADVVVGTQAHQPQAIEFRDGKPIFYGLGNLFFDQTWSAPTCQSLVVRLVVHDGELLAAELIPTVMGADCQPHIAVPVERDAILREVFRASGW